MAVYKYLVIFVLVIIINPTRCDMKRQHKRVEQLNNISIEMYEDITKANIKKDLEDRLMYPKGDKHKLSKLSGLWREYYTCTVRLLNTLTTTRQLPSIMLMVYQGAVARLPCTVCVAPGERDLLTWMYAKSTDMNFTEIEDKERLAKEHGVMTIYNVMPNDAGMYRCHIGDSSGGLVVLEVVDGEETYNVVKPPSSRGPLAVAPEIYHGIRLFSLWSQWSECSVCGKVGRRHRYGLCYVKPDQTLITFYRNKAIGAESYSKFIDLDNKLIELFEAFPDGIPCRSQHLPRAIRSLDAVQQRSSEIMIGMCKVNCKDRTRKSIQATDGTVGRINTTGIQMFSLTQVLPKQPPLPARNTIFADFGQQIAIRCPGTTLRDVPILWRIGTKHLAPRDVDKASRGRVHINSRDHLVFTAVFYRDANLYSCWQWDNLAGTVKLIVWEGAHARWNHHVTLAIVVAIAAIVLRVVVRGLRNIQQRQNIMYHLLLMFLLF